MSDTVKRPIDEALLSGYLDGTLSQAESQRVRLLIEDDAEYRALYEDLQAMRAAAATTRFVEPEDDAWPEWPRTKGSWFSRSLGWVVIVAWLVVVSGYALWHFLAETGDPFEIFLVLGLPGGFVLLFISVLIDRLRELRTDRYRGVHR